ncbi:MAG: flagellar motor switch protein FliM [Rhodospirillaceae bacterium]|nr:flagellar motor switch protein FliM [Rhodospirillaceae bacterium]MBT4490128.1 flagellar motor switch protein FliM [Rhodospirillaceae bacterium]MBT5049652.1 flagellar motor switch protein FliM [Rhodospirillaceae bacterium]MBT6426516.1 flagellar motor switch protein FliM [Rhodospirillaceae bacterium]
MYEALDDDDEAVDDDDVAAEWAAMVDDDGDGDGDGGEDGSSDDDVAAEWAAMAEEDGDDEEGDDDSSGAVNRVLNQDEIDSLLGFDADGDDDGQRLGIRAIINSALVSYERLPMLEVVFDRLVRVMSTSLRNFTSDNVEVSLDNITSIRFGDYLNSIPLPAMLTVFKAAEWDNYGLLTVDSSLIYSIVDVLLGGRRGTAAMRIEGRPYTTIEISLVEEMVHVVLADLSASFEPLSPVNFVFDRLETNPRFATIARPANAAVLIRLRIDMEDRGGRLELLLPYATLEPIRELLLQMFMGEKFGRDAIWESHLATEIWSTNIELEAVLEEQLLTIGEVMNLEVGQTMMLNSTADSTVQLNCGGISLLQGKMGRVGAHVAVNVTDGLANEGA